MGRVAWIAVAMILLIAPAAQAGVLSLIEDAGKVAVKDAVEGGTKGVEADGVKIENKVGGLHPSVASVEANGVKIENGSGGGAGGNDDPPVWFYVLCVAGLGGWLFMKVRRKRA